MGKGGLGSGMDLLFEDNVSQVQVKKTLRLSEIEPNRAQPRKNFDETAIAALADSIREHGVLQPLLVRPLAFGGYQIVAGERRWRAARMLGLDEVPVVIRDLSDKETAQISLIENLQRENLNPIEEAMGYQRLQDEFAMTQDEIAKTVGRSRSAVANALRLQKLPEEVQELLIEGSLSAGAGRALLGFADEARMIEVAQKAAAGLLTVRAIEKMAAEGEKEPEPVQFGSVDSYFKEMEISLHDRLGRRVKVDFKQNKGVLVLEFYDKEDLAALAERLTQQE